MLALAFALVATAADSRADDLSDLAFQPHPGAQLPLATALTDDTGRSTALGRFFTGAPVVLVLEYLRCKSLCGVTLDTVIAALDALPLEPGRDFRLVAVSIDPRDGAPELAAAKAKYLSGYHHAAAGEGVHFLGGPEPAVRRIAEAVGFPYRRDSQLDQYIHPAGFVVAAPDGRISRYVLGVGVTAAELRAALDDARQERAIGPLTRILLFCHLEGAAVGRYAVPIEAAFAIANLLGVAGLIVTFAAIRRRRHG